MTVISEDFVAGLLTRARGEGVTGFVAGAVVRDGGRVLLLRRRADDFLGGLWEIPSGRVEAGEDVLAALRRETAEETGLAVASVDTYLGYFDYTGSRGGTTRQFTFAVSVAATGPVVLSEHDAHQWAAPAELPAVSDAVRALLGRV
jgi:8-oxo-dGTP diphosphatase